MASQSGILACGVLGIPAHCPLSCPELTSDLTNSLVVTGLTSQLDSLSERGGTG